MEEVLNDGHPVYNDLTYANDEQFILDDDLQEFNLSTFTIVDSVSSSSSGIGGMLKVVGASWAQTRISWWLLFSLTVLGLVALYFGPSYSVEPDGKYSATVYYGKESKFRLEYWGQNNDPQDIKKGVARGFYQPDISKSGWATLEVQTQEHYSDEIQALAAGMLEGALSWQMILHHWQNTIQKTCVGRQEFCARARDFLRNNAETVRRTAQHFDAIDPFWHQVNLFYIQLDGIEVGWRSGIRRSRRSLTTEIPHIDFLWMNVMPDLRDLERRFNGTADFNPYRPPLSFVLLKFFPEDPSNFILAHGSSGTYNSMLRIQKRYNFAYHSTGDADSDLVNGQILTFTSYPGTIFSGDDFYQVRSGSGETLTVAGTELKNQNQSSWSLEEDEPPVLIGPRVMAANRLSRDGGDWSALFTRRNSGTGNKQWLILETTDNFTAWAVEQMPGLTHAQEVTQRIVEDRVWIACGIPYFQDILTQSEGSGDSSLIHLKNINPLYLALRKYAANVTTVASVVDMVRSYDISVIGRSDLNGNSNLYGYLNVTHSISRHHNHQHGTTRTRKSEVDATEKNVDASANGRHKVGATVGKSVLGKSSDASVGTSENHEMVGLPDAVVKRILSSEKDALPNRTKAIVNLKAGEDFHSANYYEHRALGPAAIENNDLIVEVKKDFEEIEADGESHSSGNTPLVEEESTRNNFDSQYRGRHKYAGVYDEKKREDSHIERRDVESIKSRDDVERLDGSDSVLSNTVSSDASNESSDSHPGDNRTSSSTKSQEGNSVSDNQTNDTQRSQNSSSNSSKQSSKPGSLSSTDEPSRPIVDDRSLGLIKMLKAYSTLNNSDSYPENNFIETKISSLKKHLEKILENSSTEESEPTKTKLSSQSSPKNHLEKPSENSSNSNTAHVNYKVVPKIDIEFKSSKHLYHGKPYSDAPRPVVTDYQRNPNMDVPKPATFGSGIGFLNFTKQFRGIIDVKISQGDGDFIAISGPPYYQPRHHGSNLTASAHNADRSDGNLPPQRDAIVHPTSRMDVSPPFRVDREALSTSSQDFRMDGTFSSSQDAATSASSKPANVDPFQWSKSYIRHQKHVGHPDLWNFDEFQAAWVWS